MKLNNFFPISPKFNLVKYFLLFLLSLILFISNPIITNAQIPFLTNNLSSDSSAEFAPWWQWRKVRTCGKFLCSDIQFPYFPYSNLTGFFQNRQSFTIASRTDLSDPESTVKALEIRAQLVEQTNFAIYKRIVRNFDKKSDVQLKNKLKVTQLKPQEWLIFHPKPLHPLTPEIQIGKKNDLTVLFLPSQEELGLFSETIITITEDDSIYNGESVTALANQWREIIRQDISEALWGEQFNRTFVGARLAIIGVIIVLTIIPIVIMTIISRFIRQLDLHLKRKIKELQDLAKKEIEASYYNESVSEIQEDSTVVNNDPLWQNRDKFLRSSFAKKILIFLHINQQKLSEKLNNFWRKNQVVSLSSQNIIKQLQNLTTYLLRLLLWLRFLLLFFGLGFVACIYPQTRVTSFFFIVQGIFLPVIWMFVSLANITTSFIIDYYLNRWATEGKINNPNSDRYTLRVATYSPALKGASSFLFIIIGIVLTVQMLGIDPSVLASAGGIAILVGFLARNVLEDMFNGILILWTDRYAIGDVISVAGVGGFVEDMNLYNTQIRGAEGSLFTIPNGQITMVQNKTKDWSRVDFTIEISANSDTHKAMEILQQVAEDLMSEDDWKDMIIEPPKLLGIDQVSHQGKIIKFLIKTKPIKQWTVGREFRLRVSERFKQEGIELGIPQRQVWHRDDRQEDDLFDDAD